MINLFKHLVPRSPAFGLTVNRRLRQFFDGLTWLPTDIKAYIDKVFFDLFPQTTRQLAPWEQQFALPEVIGFTEQQRRDRLAAAFKATGGQSRQHLQSLLQGAEFEVYVHDWWEPIPGRADGGSINNDVDPVARDPSAYLHGSSLSTHFAAQNGVVGMQNNDEVAQNGYSTEPLGYLLVNRVIQSLGIQDAQNGAATMQNGNALAQNGAGAEVFGEKQYPIPTDSASWVHFVYIGGAVFGDLAYVPIARRREFENFCLRICPAHLWIGVLVQYS